MTRILFLYAVYKVLKIIAVPFFAEPLHDIDPVPAVTLSVFRKLVKTAFTLAQEMGAYIFQILIIDMDLAGSDLVFNQAVCVLPRNRVSAGFIQDIRHPLAFKAYKTVG